MNELNCMQLQHLSMSRYHMENCLYSAQAYVLGGTVGLCMYMLPHGCTGMSGEGVVSGGLLPAVWQVLLQLP